MGQQQHIIPPLLRPDEVAEMLQVTPTTIRNWIRAGKLPAVKFPGRRGVYRIPAPALSALVEDSKTVETRDGHGGREDLTNCSTL